MRDLERWKDKVELSLDGRQIFFLFFGSAVVACLVFVAGVWTGKHVEQRALAGAAPTSDDPLAALDQLGTDDDGLTFHQALAPATAAGDRHGRREPPRPEPRHEAPKPELKPVVKVAPKAAARPELKHELPRPPVAAKPERALPGNHFTLQLSAFTEKDEAEQFMQKVQSAGFRPFLIQSDIPGRGVFYRVRAGDYATRKAADDARVEIEKRQHVMAYVAKL